MGGGTMQYEKDCESGKRCRECDERHDKMIAHNKMAQIEIKKTEIWMLENDTGDTKFNSGYLAGLKFATKLFNK